MKTVFFDTLWYYAVGLPLCFLFGTVLLLKAKLGQLSLLHGARQQI
ncbi:MULTISPECIES: hypothetical protein [Caproicibacterium]|uniref:Uncharacterized protein n=1 Tax=Caproicibacterium argilliputei TaxID=3030016 RepID=A0AA97DD85_9FIRM|nr:hypothetical protein [Caproicibacterium argilliputei]WOC33385.1 hypothetical protein PXC00_05830 [Caproicibacterium argilliputei]